MTTPTVMVNGAQRQVIDVEPHVTALDWLRDQGLTGAKEGCAEGECGACSIMVARPDCDGRTRWTGLNACLVPVLSLDGQELVTAEGLGKPGALHPVQQEMARRGGSQCGYCTPGFICSMAAEYYRPDRTPADPSSNGKQAADHEHGPNGFDLHALSGNLCRCTGYRPIRDAAYALGAPPVDDSFAQRCATPAPAAPATRVRVGDAEYVRPADLAEAVALLAERPDATVIAGCTDWGVEVNLRGSRAPFVVAVDRLPELRTFSVGPSEIELGAALTLSEAERWLAGRIPLLDQLWPQFASRLIRNGATLGGNLGTASPIGDAPPALLTLEAKVVLAGPDGDREVALADYFTGYRQTVKAKGELIRAIRIPMPPAPMVAFHKIAKRRFDDISSVAIAFAFDVVDGVVQRVSIGLGGVAATPLRATATEDALRGQPWTADTVRQAAAVLGHEGTPIDDHRASAAFRAAMLEQSLLKFHAESAVPEGVTS
ncbi:xanthine dehydrogenase small subunit [Mycobacterium sp. 852013-50091_SCH5140682]|uniref:xanthine dehydrogenase small subunit n=1 Tax=Mycobacterium sp. 852013-50091_SCH5140682 TaxID=1834109 RepID=UPI0007EAB435|nr:FAD binding domain-containing protein [Mycobacterium sp. 852013-50091_SCH5140682]OBC14219.1 xanthine dehydrogenase small subunit [Mycobacterium sp. 852013-50091_SCH5140682]